MKHINGVSMLVTVIKWTFHRPSSGWPHSQRNQYNLKDSSERLHGIHRPKCMWLQECQHRSFTYSMTICNTTALIFWCFEMVIWRIKWHLVFISNESRFCFHASDSHLYVQCWLEEQYLPKCTCPWHTDQKLQFLLTLHVYGRNFKQYHVHCEYCFNPFCNRKAIFCSSRIMPANMMPVLLNMLCKMFNNFSGQYDHLLKMHVTIPNSF